MYTFISLRSDMGIDVALQERRVQRTLLPILADTKLFICHHSLSLLKFSLTGNRLLKRSCGSKTWISLSHRTSGPWGNGKDINRPSHRSPFRCRPSVRPSSIFCGMRRHHHLRCPCYYGFVFCSCSQCRE